ncbi:MAG: hypothetical protein RJB66_2708 [Pseudomonadota bacterium]|jgi:ribosomal protein S18 acetylase RimI-like enzyme
MKIEFADALLSQVKEIAHLVNGAYRGEGSKIGWTTEADLLDGQRADAGLIAALVNPPDSKILLAISQTSQQVIGCVHLEKRNTIMYLGMLVVMPGLQAQGLGKQMIVEAQKQAHLWGCDEIEMSVLSVRAELIAWYVKQGFMLTGERKPFPSHDPRFGIPKVSNLEFVILKKNLAR